MQLRRGTCRLSPLKAEGSIPTRYEQHAFFLLVARDYEHSIRGVRLYTRNCSSRTGAVYEFLHIVCLFGHPEGTAMTIGHGAYPYE